MIKTLPKEFKITERLDCRGHLCPVPILMTEEKVAQLKARDVVEVAFTDPGAVSDLMAWCRATGNELLGFKKEAAVWFAAIRKQSC